MKPAPVWQRRPKRRARLPDLAPTPAVAPADRGELAQQWAADQARRRDIIAGTTDLTEQARRLYEAGEIGREMALSLGVTL